MSDRHSFRLTALTGALSLALVVALGVTGAGAVAAPPAAPTGVTALAGFDGAEVTWTVPADGGAPITSFLITSFQGGTAQGSVMLTAGVAGSTASPTPGAHDTFDIVGHMGGTGFSFTVAATNSAGTGPASAPSNAVNPSSGATAPYPPPAVLATAGGTSINVAWIVPIANGSPITSFLITPFKDGVAQPPTPETTLSTTAGVSDNVSLSNFVPGSTYTFTVTASNSLGMSGQSAPSNAVVATQGSQSTLTVSPTSFAYGEITLGDISADTTFTYTNNGAAPVNITDFAFSGMAPDDFLEPSQSVCQTETLAPGASCTIQLGFLPGALGTRTATVAPIDGSSNAPTITLSGTGTEGYYIASSSGVVDAFGDAQLFGDLSHTPLPAPIVGVVPTGDDGGYYLFNSLGDIAVFGDASDFGSLSGVHLNRPIVGMTMTPDGGGYVLVASDGGVFTFGDAQFFGSTGNLRLNQPIVGIAETPDGGGYWMVASDGGVFAFGDAPFIGSLGNLRLNQPILGMAATPDGGGYWMVASDGGIFAFGDAPFLGSTGNLRLNRPIVGLSATPDGGGYWMVASDGGLFTFGDAPFYGSDGGRGLTNVTGMAGDGPPTFQAIIDAPAVRSHVLAGTGSRRVWRG